MNNRLSTFVLVLLLSTLIFSGCKATTDQPQGWIRYDNEKYGYNLHYPPDCTFGALPAGCKEKPPEERPQECLCFINGENPDDAFLQAFLGEGDQLTLAGFTVSHYDTPVFNPPPGTDLIGWIKDNFSEMFEDIPDETNMEIGGIPAVSIYSPPSPMAPSYEEIYFIKNDILFRINMLDVDNDDNRELYDFVLQSFSFKE
ncbi:MAG TPA: hypothetical protein G4O11_11660 [Anaerolineae bacterium]|nr:hypothetical protein [Anaerolineae bacterium]